MSVAGLHPIIAHPERNPSVLQNPERLKTLIQSGALVQITAASLTGEFGLEYQACAMHLLREQMVSFIASDGHDPVRRPPILSAAFKTAKKRVGKKMATALFSGNAEKVIEGKPVNERKR